VERLVEVEQVSFEENNQEASLRPSSWEDYIGQEKIKKNLRVFIDASKKRNEP
jgi:Holliday junction DNA helicase RuvB